MSTKQIIMWGAAGQSRSLYECILTSEFELQAIFESNPELQPTYTHIPHYYGTAAFEQWIAQHNDPQKIYYAVAIGGFRGVDRVTTATYLASFGMQPATLIHATAFAAQTATIGAGSQLLAQSAVNAQATLGEQCIVNTGASVDHDSRLGKGVHVCPGARLAGYVTARDYASIGMGALILQHRTIGEHAIVGAGAVVLEDVPAHAVVVGNPARILRMNKERQQSF